MTHKNAICHDASASDKLELSILSRGQLIQMVVDLRQRLGKQRAHADCERELVAIHHDIAEREREAIIQVNHQLLTQINVF